MLDIDIESLLRTRADAELPELAIFGRVSASRSLEEVIGLLRDVRYYETSNVAAYGMALCSALHPKGQYRDDVLRMLDRLSLAKALIDHRICHTFPVVAVTAEVLQAAQKFADEATIPCTEWPSVEEVHAAVLKAASVHAKVERPRNPALLSAYLAERSKEYDVARVVGLDCQSQLNMRARVEAVYSARPGAAPDRSAIGLTPAHGQDGRPNGDAACPCVIARGARPRPVGVSRAQPAPWRPWQSPHSGRETA